MKIKILLTLTQIQNNMKRLFLVFTISICCTFANAQNPFEKYGYTPKIATLSKGKYNEFHDLDTIVQIGTVLFNTQSKQIVAFLQVDTLYSEATLQPDIVSMWMSPDPLSDERPGWTPYNYCQNNPINRKDPSGLLDDWYETKDKQVVYSESIRSQKDLDAAGIDGKYIGITGYTSDKQQYLSLLGEKFNTKNADGQTNLKAEMVKNLDNAIINMYKAEYKNQNRQGFD